jgi:uncharacterized repeat protein (TIGR03803 family)
MTTAERAHVPAYSVLHSFKGGSDGAFPSAGFTNVDGALYGTTSQGGDGCSGSYGCGTVYSISASGAETVLHAFKGGSADGAYPAASLLNVNGTLYGTTAGGGSNGYGTVFSITTSGKETVLYSFKGGSTDGESPLAALLDVNDTLYGTTLNGGASCSGSHGCGTVFSITTSGEETVLYSFKSGDADGQFPYAGLINVKGILYGTTNWGGAHCGGGLACGTVFSITRSGKETVRYSFKGGADGQNPQAALIKVKDKLYGTVTGLGAYCRCGTVFAVTPSGTETVLHSFGDGRGDGEVPQAALIDMHGKLYGTTEYGGTGSIGGGTVFEISTSGKERVLHSFGTVTGDGIFPVASLINVKGTLYGTTSQGGSVYCSASGYLGCGTVFALKP